MSDFAFLLWLKLVALSVIWGMVGILWTMSINIGSYSYIFGVLVWVIVGGLMLLLGWYRDWETKI